MHLIKRLNGRPEDVFANCTLSPSIQEGRLGDWSSLELFEIGQYPWLERYPYRCNAEARLGISDEGLMALMYAFEDPIIARETRWGGDVYLDSCLELFIMPFPGESKEDLNIEINPEGVAHVGCGEGREGRYVHRQAVEGMDIHPFRTNGLWGVSFCMPNSLVIEHFGRPFKPSGLMKGNFYKCSGPLLHEHYGCWNHVGTEKPDFHRPEYFGDLIIAE